jgi:hypothetical protein
MPRFNVRYRFIDKDTREELSSAPNFMTVIKKDGNIAMVHTRANKVVHVSKAENMILQVATRKVNGNWLYETITPDRNKETLMYKLKKLIKKIKGE